MISRVLLFTLVFFSYNASEAQIGAKIKEQEGICGTWSNHDFAFQMKLVLNPDGSAEFDGGSLQYKLDGNTLTLTQAGKDVNYSYKVQSNLLHLSDGDLEDTLLFERNGAKELSAVQNEDFQEEENNVNLNLSLVHVGQQIWSTKNLNVTKFRNGDSIQEAKTNQEWRRACNEGRPCWCYYNNESQLGKKYGILYNWFAVSDPRGLAPAGWHIPNNEEWMSLADRMVGSTLNEFWLENPNTLSPGDHDYKSVNEVGPVSKQGGFRDENGKFMAVRISSNWWSASEESKYYAGASVIRNQDFKIKGTTGLKACGASVRCVKD